MSPDATAPTGSLAERAWRRATSIWLWPWHWPGREARRALPKPRLADLPAHATVSFWRREAGRRILLGFSMVAVVMTYGVSGYMAMGWSFMDAFYQVFITISAVGLTEVHPLDSTILRVHTMATISMGLFAVGYTVGGFISLLTEGEFQKFLGQQRIMKSIANLTGHTIVAGYGRVGAMVCEGLAGAGMPFVVIEQDPARAAEMQTRGFTYILGDATDEGVLRDAGVGRAAVLVTSMPGDAANVFITLTARELCPNIDIIARAEQPSTQKKLRQAGANHVIMPAAIGAHRIVSLLTNPTAVEFVELVTQRSSLQIEMDDIPIVEGSPLAGLSLRDADVGRLTGVIVIAIKNRDGHLIFPARGDEVIGPGDSLVILGKRSNLDQFREKFLS
ncbi:Inner membrane protein YbaL [Aquisphaera giovannonii]|uniref:Inner membrane protein YbaL n=1 Tax=Aquisphaera giovannonii TaxID=406548 RepID=A0A5B9WA88_9BACT|nr:potassium channel protein [Aquisphaera giovannonii]QEH37446.1 Inner membrane protein YbaL [Aquisphaera giovannonii]